MERVMRFGFVDGDMAGAKSVADFIDNAVAAESAGLDSYWVANFLGHDAMTVALAAGLRTERIEVGTNVTPIHPRHPAALAQQARTVAALTGERFTLGVGVSHRVLVEGAWGLSYDAPWSYMQEYLDALIPLVAGERTQVRGARIAANTQLSTPDPSLPGLVVAALGPKMVDLAARRTSGLTTWLVGPNSIAETITPIATAASGTEAVRIIAGIPMCVTTDTQTARELAHTLFGYYDRLPAYRDALARDHITGAAEAALIGTADQITERIYAYRTAGATDFGAFPFGTATEQANTLALLAQVAKEF